MKENGMEGNSIPEELLPVESLPVESSPVESSPVESFSEEPPPVESETAAEELSEWDESGPSKGAQAAKTNKAIIADKTDRAIKIFLFIFYTYKIL